uniref:non-specific serine/threonine protein kinase n=1 Tax=Zea mays TaxID=4577 RepID=A0A804R3Q9_MAIZE
MAGAGAGGWKKRVGRYEVGRTIGRGTFAKVKFAVDADTGAAFAIKVLDKETIFTHRMLHQIKREISIMKIVRHPNIVRLNEVLAGRTKIYIVLELVTGGELFDRIVRHGKLRENEARKYFQQLIDAIDYCHSKGVYHRDLKPQNLLLDSRGNLKLSDFGLSTLSQNGVGLVHTTCGTPNYVAPEVLSSNGYDGSAADIWSCGVILYVLMAGYLPFEENDLPHLYEKITAAQYSCPYWFSPGAKSLIQRILDPNPRTEFVKRQTRFVSRKPAKTVVATIEVVAESMGLKVHSRNYKVFEVAPSLFMVDVRKVAGDTPEYHRFYENLCSKLCSIIWRPTEVSAKSTPLRTTTC